MLAKDLISGSIDPLRTSDRGEEAITLMNLFHVTHMPIVNNEELLGTLSEDDILNHDILEPIGSYALSLNAAFVRDQDHLFEVMHMMAHQRLSVIPVVDIQNRYVGLITQEDILSAFGDHYSFKEPGSILIIETDKINYSLVEIARIVEEESAKILSTFLSFDEDSNRVQVTLKINRSEISRIVASFIRYDYTIIGSFVEDGYQDVLQDRYESLIHFLNV